MTEFFTMAPYSCGEHDPTTDYHRLQEEPTEGLAFLCAMRNVYGVVLTLIASLGIVGNVFCLVILPKTGGSKSAIVMLFTLGVYDTLYLASGIFLNTEQVFSIIETISRTQWSLSKEAHQSRFRCTKMLQTACLMIESPANEKEKEMRSACMYV
ncbi:hypothetical protein RRG08_028631 [Elysia crispata]|uniref:Uncharacterized protein n=1 Tax=Elysia crispata TaxID=231223 RepID=A0AAE0ZS54_9GAST|nr:hypothetical protein RRG08_028631 [Elysia crispata]